MDESNFVVFIRQTAEALLLNSYIRVKGSDDSGASTSISLNVLGANIAKESEPFLKIDNTFMENSDDLKTRRQLADQLRGRQAFIPIEKLLEEIDFEDLGIRPHGLPYSFYEQFFHLRVAQYDILEFSRNPDYEAPVWPEEYWPVDDAPETGEEWENLKKGYFDEREAFIEHLLDQSNDLYKPLLHGDGQTLLREAMLILEHSAYHTGQLAIILRLLDQENE